LKGTAGEYIRVDRARCLSCAACAAVCPTEALALEGLFLRYDREKCVRCGECVPLCPRGALLPDRAEREAP